ncbi:hypothetical protein H5410_013446 [Solanum commersonii]|uniref:Uncharacterized protein n=1 Tax=Solanum commersonii TaxID=4109 RepID=A0A9J6AUW6_SOLCO|nr:hypothetical protein H5410_013446 [Solanum commersonii]
MDINESSLKDVRRKEAESYLTVRRGRRADRRSHLSWTSTKRCSCDRGWSLNGSFLEFFVTPHKEIFSLIDQRVLPGTNSY